MKAYTHLRCSHLCNETFSIRTPCSRKETARYRSCSFRFKVRRRIHYKSKSSQASKARLQSSKRTGAKQNLTQNGHSRYPRSRRVGHGFDSSVDWIGLDWIGLDWIGSNFLVKNWIGLDWVRSIL